MNQKIAIQDTFCPIGIVDFWFIFSSWRLSSSKIWKYYLFCGLPGPVLCHGVVGSLLSDRLVVTHCLPQLGTFTVLLHRGCARRWKSKPFPSPFSLGERGCYFVPWAQVLVHNSELSCAWFVMVYVMILLLLNSLLLNMGVNFKKRVQSHQMNRALPPGFTAASLCLREPLLAFSALPPLFETVGHAISRCHPLGSRLWYCLPSFSGTECWWCPHLSLSSGILGTQCTPAFPSLTVHLWGTEEVAAWLEHLSLCEYKDIFIRHDVRGSELLHLERRDLKVLSWSAHEK